MAIAVEPDFPHPRALPFIHANLHVHHAGLAGRRDRPGDFCVRIIFLLVVFAHLLSMDRKGGVIHHVPHAQLKQLTHLPIAQGIRSADLQPANPGLSFHDKGDVHPARNRIHLDVHAGIPAALLKGFDIPTDRRPAESVTRLAADKCQRALFVHDAVAAHLYADLFNRRPHHILNEHQAQAETQ